MKYYLIFLFVLNIELVISDGPLVRAPTGPIRGTFKNAPNGREYQVYEGIPFAVPPLGSLRFEPPVKLPPWTDTFSAQAKCDACMSYDYTTIINEHERVTGSEDCLCINVYVPQTNDTSKPVNIFVDGSAFQFGGSQNAEEKFIMERNIIFVSFNYRFGPLGFLSTNSDKIPGNMGLKDQVLAFRWVQENIESFGGDPDNVLLNGALAGGTSVHLHYLSPMSEGLFQKGIIFTGNALSPWAFTSNADKKAKKLAEILGCPSDEENNMVACLKGAPAKMITKATEQFFQWRYHPPAPFGPVIEPPGPNSFLSDSPFNLLSNGQVQQLPLFMVMEKDVGLWSTAYCITHEECLQYLDENFNEIIPYILSYNEVFNDTDQMQEVSQQIRQEYFQDSPINMDNRDILTQLVTDRGGYCSLLRSSTMHAKVSTAPVFATIHAMRATDSFSYLISGTREDLGIAPADSLITVMWNVENIIAVGSSRDYAFQQTILDYFENYFQSMDVYFGNTPFQPISTDTSNFTVLIVNGPDNVSYETFEDFGNCDFWNSLGLTSI